MDGFHGYSVLLNVRSLPWCTGMCLLWHPDPAQNGLLICLLVDNTLDIPLNHDET